MVISVHNGSSRAPASEALVSELVGSGLFDEAYYLSQLDGAIDHPFGAAGHYLEHGAGQGLSPHPLFDPHFFLSQNSLEKGLSLPPFLAYVRSTGVEAFQPHPLFDARFYLDRNPDLLECANKINPLWHYVKHGAFEGRNPNQYFSSEWYLKRKPSLRSNKINPLIDYITSPVDQLCPPHPLIDKAPCIDEVAQTQAQTCADGADREPIKNQYRIASPAVPPYLGVEFATRAGLEILPWDTAFDRMITLSREPFSHLFIIPGLIRGGAERAACSYIKYCQKMHGADKVLVILADYDLHSAIHWLAEYTRLIDARKLLPKEYGPADMATLLAAFLMKKRPEATYVINSFSAITALGEYRDVLRSCSRFVVHLFGFETYTNDEFALLRIPVFQIALSWVDCIITDTARLADAVKDHLQSRLSPGKTTTQCYVGSEHLTSLLGNPDVRAPLTRRGAKKILWASRLTQSKRPDLFAEIARRVPHVEFVAYGSSDADLSGDSARFLELLEATSNITLGGEFSDFESLDLRDIAGFLYTSDSDGIPWVLLEATAAGLPIVASRVGGIGEFLSDDSAWLVDQFNDVEAYAAAIEELLSDSDLACEKIANARLTLMIQHSEQSLATQLQRLPKY
jgi:glycosyltransferase involved in cell wall biosynthesis